jgi:exopolysaccharide biosynthesis polyprenyl glycosylphosphotransferase
VGSDEAGKHVMKSLEKDPFSDFHIAGFLDDYRDIEAAVTDRFKNLGKLIDIQKITESMPIDEIIIAIDHAPYDRLIYVVEKCIQTGKYVRIYSDVLNVVADKMDVELYANIPVIELPQHNLNSPTVKDKRSVDIILAVFSLLLLSPLFLAIAVGIKLSSKGPVVFKQIRVGKNGKIFNFFKFRSMHTGVHDTRHREFVQNFIKGNPNKGSRLDEAKGINVFKITHDPRIFKFGKLLRKTSLDEFPQFVNVLKGEMSLVGPRPCLPYEWDQYEDWHKKRLNILPGCTGLWQALGRNSVTFEEMVILDLYYISNLSLWLDFKIILKTLPVIFMGKGGY